jgi:hypothetical protein
MFYQFWVSLGPKQKEKLSQKYNLNDETWEQIHCVARRCTKDPKLRQIQYSILNNYIVTNQMLEN